MNHQQISLAVDFLKQCQMIAQKINIKGGTVYGLLEDFSISADDKLTNKNIHPLKYSNYWHNFFGKTENIFTYAWGNYWTGFDNGNTNRKDKFIKIYLSLDRKHLFEGVKQLFNFIAKENISHTSKSTSIVRTDNVIIRLNLDDIEGLKKITKYIENNNYIQEGMNSVNPFLPTVGKIGVMFDDGRSYNSDLAYLIAQYINKHLYDSEINFSDFAKFIKEKKCHDRIFMNTFNQAFFEKGPYQNIIENTQNQTDLTSTPNIPLNDKEYILKLAINTSFEKYGKAQAIAAIKNALHGNYSYFSRVGYDELGNEIELRSYLEKNLSPKELHQYILKNNNLENDIVRNYVDCIIYEYKGCLLEDALYATAKKYFDLKENIEIRINNYANNGDVTMFCRNNFDIKNDYNFRESVLKNIPPSKTYDVVESILHNKGINYLSKLNEEKVNCCAQVIMERIESLQM